MSAKKSKPGPKVMRARSKLSSVEKGTLNEVNAVVRSANIVREIPSITLSTCSLNGASTMCATRKRMFKKVARANADVRDEVTNTKMLINTTRLNNHTVQCQGLNQTRRALLRFALT